MRDIAVIVLTVVGLLGTAVGSFFAFRFAWVYRNVEWRGNPWGEHVMHFSVIIGVLMAWIIISNVLSLLGYDFEITQLVISNVILWAAAYELYRRNTLERRAQRMRRDASLPARQPSDPSDTA